MAEHEESSKEVQNMQPAVVLLLTAGAAEMLAFSIKLKGVPFELPAAKGFSVSDGGPPSLQKQSRLDFF
jgi:hypothetical protein